MNQGKVINCSPPGMESLVLEAVERYKKENPERKKLLYCLDNNFLVKFQGVDVKPLKLSLKSCECEILSDAVFRNAYGGTLPATQGDIKLIDFVDLEFSI